MNCTEFEKLNALRISSIYKLSTEKLSYLLFDFIFLLCVIRLTMSCDKMCYNKQNTVE